MTRVNQVDQALLVLREQLQRMGKLRGRQANGASANARAIQRPMARLVGLASLDALPDEQFRRTLVRALLAEELGDTIASDPAFVEVIDDVFRIVTESEEGRDLVARATQQVRGNRAG